MPPVTVVIPTFNRFLKLNETIRSLGNQSRIADLVIVVDDGSTDGSVPLKRDLLHSCPFKTILIEQPNGGASTAINRGVEEAPDGLIILFDDDIIPHKETIRRHIEFHAQHADCVLSGSADTDPATVTTDVQRYKLHMELQWLKARPDTVSMIKVDFSNFIITTANMSFNKATYKRVGGFDVSLRDGYDVEFGFKALLKGVPLYFDRTIKSMHNDQISLEYYAGRQRAYDRSKKLIFKQYPGTENRFPVVHTKISRLKSVAYGILRMKLTVKFVQSRFFAAVFPQSFRYSVYGSTIAALSLTRAEKNSAV